MGYTVAAALHRLGADGQLVVAELVPAVVRWNKGPLAHMAGCPLQDDRVTVREVDVAEILKAEHGAYDAILMDVDNGPEGLTRKGNGWLWPSRCTKRFTEAYFPAKPCSSARSCQMRFAVRPCSSFSRMTSR